jgi:hypothetical protein
MRHVALALALSAAPASAQQAVGLLDQADLNQIISAVLTHKVVSMYLHPEVPGRLPVKVAIAAPYSEIPVGLVLYGKPVKVVSPAADAVNLAISPSAEGAVVRVSYRQEGIVGTVTLKRGQAQWTAIGANIYEQ